MDVLEKPKNVLESPGKSWNFEFKMLWPPCSCQILGLETKKGRKKERKKGK